jgi:hypothetical protein
MVNDNIKDDDKSTNKVNVGTIGIKNKINLSLLKLKR